jgi:hypothetical protein
MSDIATWRASHLEGSGREPAQPRVHIASEIRLAELAVVNHVNSLRALLANDIAYGASKLSLMSLFIFILLTGSL